MRRSGETCIALLLTLLLAAFSPQLSAQQPAHPHELRIAAAADLQPALPVIAGAFEFATKIKVTITYGSSATLAEQLTNGAPFDLFLAADYSFPERVIAAGRANERTPIPYALGTLVLWARKDSPLQPITIDSLRDPRLQKLAIANPFHAPYGRAAVDALKNLHLYDALQPRLVTAENISQAAQFVESGNAQLGLISLTTALSEHFQQIGTFIRVPPPAYLPLRQCAVTIKGSPNVDSAQKFLQFLTDPHMQPSMRNFGLEPAQ